jgi:hypothetical protein
MHETNTKLASNPLPQTSSFCQCARRRQPDFRRLKQLSRSFINGRFLAGQQNYYPVRYKNQIPWIAPESGSRNNS